MCLSVLFFAFFVAVKSAYGASNEVTRPGNAMATTKQNVLQPSNLQPITVKIRPTQVQLGEPVTLVIEGEQIGSSTALLDWSELQKQFVIDEVDQHSYVLRLTLYPLNTGRLVIPEQNAGRVHIPKTVINVKQNPQVAIEWEPPKSTLLISEQGLWKAHVKVDNPAFLVEIKPPEVPKIEGLDEIVRNVLTDANTPTLHMVSFEMPSVIEAQTVQLASPVVEIKNTTNRRWKFFDSEHTLHIHPLPSFLPMSVAVGQIDWQIAPFDTLYQVNDLMYWHWQLRGRGITEGNLKATAYQLITELSHNKGFDWLAESMQSQSTVDKDGLLTVLDVQIPFRINQPGLVSVAPINAQFFNPETQKVTQKIIEPATLVALPNWLFWMVQWFLMLLVITISYLVLFMIKQHWINLRLRKAIKLSSTSQQIWQALLDWQAHHALGLVSAQSTRSNYNAEVKSIRYFELWFKENYTASASLASVIEDLNRALYGPQNPELSFRQLKQNAQAWSNSLTFFKTIKQVNGFIWKRLLNLRSKGV